MTEAATRWWTNLGACPSCAADAAAAGSAHEGRCAGCGAKWREDASIRSWREDVAGADERHLPHEWAEGRRSTGAARIGFLGKRAVWNVLKVAGWPIRSLLQSRVDAFERRSLSDQKLAAAWRDHYLKGLSPPAAAIWFEHSYRKIEKLGFARLLGFRAAVQDIRVAPYWRDFPETWRQVVPPTAPRLPVRANVSDVVFTDGAIFDFDRDGLSRFAAECLRILKPGGHLIIWAGNSLSRTRALSEIRWHGRIHSLAEVRSAALGAGFVEVDHWFEGFAPPFLATPINTMRRALAPWPFTTYDHDSWLAALQRPERRAYWLLRLRKPAAGDGGRPS